MSSPPAMSTPSGRRSLSPALSPRFERKLHEWKDRIPVEFRFLLTKVERQTISTEMQTVSTDDESCLAVVEAEIPQKVWYFDTTDEPQMVRQEFHDALIAIIGWLKKGFPRDFIPFISTDTLRDDHTVYTNPFLGNESVSGAARLVVVGLPGIGKTTFLSYVFTARVAKNLPTLFSEGDPMYIWKNNQLYTVPVKELQYLITQRFVDENMWCLLDCNDATHSLPSSMYRSNVFFLRAASPRKERLNWVSKSAVKVEYFFTCGNGQLRSSLLGSNFN
ncbi:hypothetical protein GYMLUDRAFT_47901 [Collybiopsis luxurians FD-317 M1]|uniref:Uncharacterized protein n=1 Tax=Collybiopsis luxurians FD-317 M1 TaxID=944289 RepID=A0A0D0CJW4_9AGAR|nr:hypothetical protein GYMLUDRAFT_47901 [Collybiopsis luxurians FD-317 M1]